MKSASIKFFMRFKILRPVFFEQILGQIVSIRVKVLSNTKKVVSKEKKAHFPLTHVDKKRHCLNYNCTSFLFQNRMVNEG